MYIDYKELLPCNKCGERSEYIQQLNRGPILQLRCDCCGQCLHSLYWSELKEKWNQTNDCPQFTEVCSDSMAELSRRLIETAIVTGTVLEKNVSTLRRKHQYWPEFWNLLDEILSHDESKKVFWVKGLDAHSVEELEKSFGVGGGWYDL